jgi:hypothetical protein
MLPSFAKEIETPTMQDVGYSAHIELIDYLQTIGKTPIVLDSKSILLNPEKTLKQLCVQLGIPFEKEMLSWKAGARPEDGIWAKHWYGNVHKSTGFIEYKPKTAPFPEKLKPLLEECLPIYERLKELAIR